MVPGLSSAIPAQQIDAYAQAAPATSM